MAPAVMMSLCEGRPSSSVSVRARAVRPRAAERRGSVGLHVVGAVPRTPRLVRAPAFELARQRFGRGLVVEVAERLRDGTPHARGGATPARNQRIARCVAFHPAEGGRDLRADVVQLLAVAQRLAQRSDRLRRSDLGQLSRGLDAAHALRVVGEPGRELPLTRREVEGFEHAVRRVDGHERRLRFQRQHEAVRGLRDLDGATHEAVAHLEAQLQFRAVDRGELLVGLLRLRQLHRRLAGVAVPGIFRLELGVPTLPHPLVEEPVDVAAGRLLDRALQVVRQHVAIGVLRDVVVDRRPPRGVAQLIAEHVEDDPALLVEMTVEDLQRLRIGLLHQRSPVAAGVLLEVERPVAHHLVAELVPAVGVLDEQLVEVGREALVEPAVRPLAAGQQVTEPLVRQLVRRQRVTALDDVRVRTLVVQHRVGHRGRRGVLHAAEDEVGDGHRGVLVPRVRHADGLREEVDHPRRSPEGAHGVFASAALGVVLHRHTRGLRLGLHLVEVAGGERHQVGRVRSVLHPEEDGASAAAVVAPLLESPVRQRVPAPGAPPRAPRS